MMYRIQIQLVFILFLTSIGLSQTVSIDTTQFYKAIEDAALRDSTFDSSERYLQIVIKKFINQSIDEVNKKPLDRSYNLDQTGRWPLVAQNMVYAGAFYGWMIPWVLGIDAEKDFKWYVAGEMLGIGGAFYLTYKYTENMSISHARSQMQRTGSLMALRAAFDLNRILGITPYDEWDYEGEQIKYPKRKKLAAYTIMSSIPLGHLLGNQLNKRWQPSNGQAWVYALAAEVGGSIGRSMYQILSKQSKPYWDWDTPADTCFNVSDDYGTVVECQMLPEFVAYEEDFRKWRSKQALPDLIGMTAGLTLGRFYFKNKSYTFGDALMIYQGRYLGLLAGSLLSELAGFDFDEDKAWHVLPTAGSLAGIWLYDQYLVQEADYTFGQAALNLLGTGSGTLVGLSIAAILETNETGVELLMLGGIIAGQAVTRKLIPPSPEGSHQHSTLNDIKLHPFIGSDNSYGLSLQIEF